MRIHCDNCGAEFDKDDAIAHEVEDEIYYFCSEECYETSEYLDPDQEPERDEHAGPPAAV